MLTGVWLSSDLALLRCMHAPSMRQALMKVSGVWSRTLLTLW